MPGKKHPVVCRFKGMTASDLGGYEAHRTRKNGDVGHVDKKRSHLNRRLIGAADWASKASDEIRIMAMETFAAELENLEKRGDRKRRALRLAEGPKDPWRASRHGPLREVILTANREWFDDTGSSDVLFSNEKQIAFEERAVAWLQDNFGNDVVHARADLDEQAYHIHAVIMPRATVKKYGTECRVLQPSIHPLIKDYEKAQDSVGEWFSELGLTRGERRKQAVRDALNNGRTPPPKRNHVRPAEWRQSEEKRLAHMAKKLAARERAVVARQKEADDAIGFLEGIATGEIVPEKTIASMPKSDVAPSKPFVSSAEKSSPGHSRAKEALNAALAHMRVLIRERERTKAKTQLFREREEIIQADAAIRDMVRLLPTEIRAKIAKIRQSLVPTFIRFDRDAAKRDSAEQKKTPQETGHGRDDVEDQPRAAPGASSHQEQQAVRRIGIL